VVVGRARFTAAGPYAIALLEKFRRTLLRALNVALEAECAFNVDDDCRDVRKLLQAGLASNATIVVVEAREEKEIKE
jgi:hypothetical protein